MPSAFSTIGVPVDSDEDFDAWARRAAGEGQAMSVSRGEYRILTSNAGPQLWAGVDRRGRVVALTPHYAGTAVCRARLTDRITRADESRFEGAFDGWADSESATSEADAFCDTVPLLFDAPDYLAHLELRLPALVDVQIAAFAFDCTWHRDLTAFEAAQATAELPFAEQASSTSTSSRKTRSGPQPPSCPRKSRKRRCRSTSSAEPAFAGRPHARSSAPSTSSPIRPSARVNPPPAALSTVASGCRDGSPPCTPNTTTHRARVRGSGPAARDPLARERALTTRCRRCSSCLSAGAQPGP